MEFSREERVEAGRTGEGVIDAALTPTCTVAVSLFLDMGGGPGARQCGDTG